MLGYRCKSCDRDLLQDVILENDFARITEVVTQYDLFEDWPWPLIYQQVDKMLPGSKFILTIRKDEQTWLDSLKKHSMRTHPTRHCRKLAYGHNYPSGHEKEHTEFYRRHNANVRSFFEGRENDFIEVCWENKFGWNELCAFLQKDIPDVPFPHANMGSDGRPKTMFHFMNRVLSTLGR